MFLVDDTIQKLEGIVSYVNVKFDEKLVEKITYNVLVP